ncbi:hypothetical protein KM043_015869 [Ampulex compressa]|nr:hypothetical protein KM043_015869 [Ampulex compressa]
MGGQISLDCAPLLGKFSSCNDFYSGTVRYTGVVPLRARLFPQKPDIPSCSGVFVVEFLKRAVPECTGGIQEARSSGIEGPTAGSSARQASKT